MVYSNGAQSYVLMWLMGLESEGSMETELLADDIDELEKQFAENPENIEVILNLANAYADSGRWEDAVKTYKIAIKMDPKNGDLYNRLGIVFVTIDDPAEAEVSYLRAIACSPLDSKIYFNLGELYQVQGRWSNAKYVFGKCLHLSTDPDERVAVQEKLIAL